MEITIGEGATQVVSPDQPGDKERPEGVSSKRNDRKKRRRNRPPTQSKKPEAEKSSSSVEKVREKKNSAMTEI